MGTFVKKVKGMSQVAQKWGGGGWGAAPPPAWPLFCLRCRESHQNRPVMFKLLKNR